MEIKPQQGPQELFLTSESDIVIYGGSAGGGKTWGLLLEPLRHIGIRNFTATIFRRDTTQITNPGGLWDESSTLYPILHAEPKQYRLSWIFPSGAMIKFGHLQYEKDKYSWQGSQIAFIGFDELTHFTKSQFFYMLSRNRSVCGVRPYIRATCNADASSWVRQLIEWWIDPETGIPIKERIGKIRYFSRDGDNLIWGDTRKEVKAQTPHVFKDKKLKDLKDEDIIKSLTFIPADIYDNAKLLRKDPAYLANLMSLPDIDKKRLLDGNWNVKYTAGDYFKREWFEIVDLHEIPDISRQIRFWDLASTKVSEQNPDPDFAIGLKLAVTDNNIFYVMDVVRIRANPPMIEQKMIDTANADGKNIEIIIEQEPGSEGKLLISNLARTVLAGFPVKGKPSTGSKETRAKLVSSSSSRGEIKLLRAPWNGPFIAVLEQFPEGKHDDDVDGLSGAYNYLSERRGGGLKFGIF